MKYLILVLALFVGGCGCGGPDFSPEEAERWATHHKEMYEYYDSLAAAYRAQTDE